MYVFFSLVACYQAFVILVYFVTFYVLDFKLKLAFFKDTSYTVRFWRLANNILTIVELEFFW